MTTSTEAREATMLNINAHVEEALTTSTEARETTMPNNNSHLEDAMTQRRKVGFGLRRSPQKFTLIPLTFSKILAKHKRGLL
jgi:hypothetical protein